MFLVSASPILPFLQNLAGAAQLASALSTPLDPFEADAASRAMLLKPRQYVPASTTGATAIVIVAWMFPVLATSAVVIRFVARRLRKNKYKLDDWLILAAIVMMLNPVRRGLFLTVL